MNEQQEKLLEAYRDHWVRLNALNALRDDIEREVRDLHAKQRHIANKIAMAGMPSADEAVAAASMPVTTFRSPEGRG